MPSDRTPMFLPLTNLYEPSAIQQLPDGRFLVVEDEKQHPFNLLTIDSAGRIHSTPLKPAPGEGDDAFWKLDDLEGMVIDRLGNIYAATSHSRDSDGDEKKSRDKLVRFRIAGDRVVASAVVNSLKPALLAAHPALAAAAAIRDVKTAGGLNIEALELSADQQQLLIGFRSPLLDRRAIIACVENPAAMFEAGEPPRIRAALTTLNLDGDGIRGMAYIPALGGYLIGSGPATREQTQFRMWFWRGHPAEPARHVTVPGLPGFEHAEGVTPADLDGRPFILVVSDDGHRESGRCARFLLLEPGQLRIAP